ncbi:hypothetical protein [Micromonospora sp. MH99]|uniref:hypothetical protein n=1 Tax=Micromonospora sp. MH99 TaxID=1945510 RepID=UPI001F22B03D|nr:hypothetical protein [Micromonospora sp. MH99]MCF0093589.1 hypothetical protein [Micromonospora sp. MH99]
MNREPAATRLEGLVLVLILIAVGGSAGAASFTHVHDWTMANSPANTPGWFGWANAVISELVPIAALLTIRRRRRTGAPIGYPMVLLLAAAGLSLAAQLAVAKPGPSGWLLSAVPALAFMALVKLVLAPATTPTADTTPATPPAVDTPPTSEPVVDTPQATVPAAITAPAFTPIPAARPEVPAHLMPTARFVIGRHEQSTGRPITTDELASLLSVTPDIARELLHTITGHTPAVNGTPVTGGAR